MEATKIPHADFKTKVIRMPEDLRGRKIISVRT